MNKINDKMLIQKKSEKEYLIRLKEFGRLFLQREMIQKQQLIMFLKGNCFTVHFESISKTWQRSPLFLQPRSA